MGRSPRGRRIPHQQNSNALLVSPVLLTVESLGRASISWELARKARGPSSPLGTLRKLAKDQEYWIPISSLSPPLVGRDGRR